MRIDDMVKKERADRLLVRRGLAESGTKANALILAGVVFSGERRIEKPGHNLPIDASLEVRGKDHPWVSRGGIKLAHALMHFGIDPSGKLAVDIGASTGGFTDVLLAGDARRVYAVDVGSGQLAWRLRNDPRVVVLEGVNARHLSRDLIAEPLDLIVCDASFIGLRTVLPAALDLAAREAELVALIKPQFEAGRENVGKGGVVRDPEVREEVCDKMRSWLADQCGWDVLGLTESPIRGPKGNVEYLIAARRRD